MSRSPLHDDLGLLLMILRRKDEEPDTMKRRAFDTKKEELVERLTGIVNLADVSGLTLTMAPAFVYPEDETEK